MLRISIQLIVDGLFDLCEFVKCAWFIRLDQTSFFFTNEIKTSLLILIPITLLLFYKLGFYKNIVRFISISFIRTAFFGFNYLINFYLFDRICFRSILTKIYSNDLSFNLINLNLWS